MQLKYFRIIFSSLILGATFAASATSAPKLTSPKKIPGFVPGDYRLVVEEGQNPQRQEELCTPGEFSMGEEVVQGNKVKFLRFGSGQSINVASGTVTSSYSDKEPQMPEEEVKNRCVYVFDYSYRFEGEESLIEAREKLTCEANVLYHTQQVAVKLTKQAGTNRPMVILDMSLRGNVEVKTEPSFGYRCTWVQNDPPKRKGQR